MKLIELLEWTVPKEEIQATLLSGMLEDNQFHHLTWMNVTDSEFFQMMEQDPTFKEHMADVFRRYLNATFDQIIYANDSVSKRDSIFGVVSFIQNHAEEKKGVLPEEIMQAIGNIDNYKVLKASVFIWNGIRFLVIKDLAGVDTHYSIYAASA